MTVEQTIPLGPFELDRSIGRGGMAEVWAGRHESGVPVAVKVLTGEKTRRPLYVQAFRREVRAMAGLHHSSIVHVFDYGQIPSETAKASGGYLTEGSPFLVMELANGGTLQDHVARMSWPQLKYVLHELLEALAHAHACGVIHRDLKPANVLLRRESPYVILTDFGLAHALDDDAAAMQEERAIGTTPFMAPEQFLCAWRDYGPWTDMYALGCLVYTMVSNATPFFDQSFYGWRTAHFTTPLPALYPQMPVPKQLEVWIHKLMAKEPQLRYQRAVEALWDLQCMEGSSKIPSFDDLTTPMGTSTLKDLETPSLMLRTVDEDSLGLEATPEVIRSALGSGPVRESQEYQHTLVGDSSSEDPLQELRNLWLFFQRNPTSKLRTLMFTRRPSLAEHWDETSPVVPSHLRGAGLGLYGLRSIPLVDRVEERMVLWQALSDVQHTRHARMVVLEGESGYGKSRLVEWLTMMAHKTSGANIFKAFHSPVLGPRDGLESMLSRFLRCVGLSRPEVYLRCQLLLNNLGVHVTGEALALTELLCQHLDEEVRDPSLPTVRFFNPTERYAVIRYLLEGLSRRRPIVVWLDDVQWGVDTLGFCQYLMQSQDLHPMPVLLVATVQQEAMRHRMAEQLQLERLLALERVHKVPIAPLPDTYRGQLVRELLGLEPSLARRVVERTEGNPLFAIQLVGDWVSRGVLVSGEQGFQLRPGATATLPDSLHELWASRMEKVLDDAHHDARPSLELAALLGREVDASEWKEVCGLVRVSASYDLIEKLLHHRLATSHDAGPEVGWSFVHGMLRESLERGCLEAGRWNAFHHACAGMLAKRSGGSAKERRGRHLLAAGEIHEGLSQLLAAAYAYTQTGDYLVGLQVLDTCEVTLKQQDISPENELWGLCWAHRSRLVQLQGEYVLGAKLAAQAEESGRSFGWSRALAEALLRGGNASRILGKSDALDKLREAEAMFFSLGDPIKLGHSRVVLGYQQMKSGDFEGARQSAEQALLNFQASNSPYMSALCHTLLADINMHTDRLEESKEQVSQAIRLYEQCGSRWGIACSLNGLGEIARLRGQLEEAEMAYRDALPKYLAIGSGSAIFPQFNLGQILVLRGRYEEAEDVLHRTLHQVRHQGRKTLSILVHLALVACAAARERWPDWESHFFQASALLESTQYVDVDIPTMSEVAGDLAVKAGQIPRACNAYKLAIEQLRALHQPEKADALSTKLLQLQS